MDHGTTYTVGDLARLSGVTVRTLHHYDEIGMLSPTSRSDGGYRQYTHADLERLQLILQYRGLGNTLVEIGGLLAGDDRLAILKS